MGAEFISYAFQDLPRKKIKKYAAQYEGVDMSVLLGADEDNFPFLVRMDDREHQVLFWNSYNGIMEHTDEDPVRAFATIQFLHEHAYPVFDSRNAAEIWARVHAWPRKTLKTRGA